MQINLIEMTNLVLLGLTVIFSLTLAESGSDSGSGDQGWDWWTMDVEDLFSDSGSNETIEAKDPNEAHVKPTSGMYLRSEMVF